MPPDKVKQLPLAVLVELMDRRVGDGLGTEGRPGWVSENLAEIEYVLLLPYTWNRGIMLRCNAVAFLRSAAPGAAAVGRFPIDLTQPEYHALVTVSGRAAGKRSWDVLLYFPMLPLDEPTTQDFAE
ncbi:hypothetical protein [Kribbella hippodromi]|uniref:hypothetical protein n=1 Tax=Kribbella hippodromi TaxID=434347 RepID=UPI0031E344C1